MKKSNAEHTPQMQKIFDSVFAAHFRKQIKEEALKAARSAFTPAIKKRFLNDLGPLIERELSKSMKDITKAITTRVVNCVKYPNRRRW